MPLHTYGGEVVARATRAGGVAAPVSALWRRAGGQAVQVADWSGDEEPATDAVTTLRQMFVTDGAERVWESGSGGFVDRSSNAVGTKAGTNVTHGQGSLLGDGSGTSSSFPSNGWVDTEYAHNHTTASSLLVVFRADPGATPLTTTSRIYYRATNMTLNFGHASSAPGRFAGEVAGGGVNAFPKWSTSTPANDETNLVMITFDGTSFRTYRATSTSNGALVSTATAAGSLTSSASTGRIGNHTNNAQGFPGRIQYVSVVPATLSLARFQAYAATVFAS
jgi:hypothetical protein